MATNYKTETFDKEHRYFGGLICEFDFNTDPRCNNNKQGSIAKRIARDLKLEQELLDEITEAIGGK